MLNLPGLAQRPVVRRIAQWVHRLSVFWRLGTIRNPTLNFEDRLAQFKSLELKLNTETDIRFNSHLVPYIIAQSDEQAAYALGCVTEFLRGPQIQFLKRLSQGRLSEMGGASYVDMDHIIRLLDFGKAIDEIIANMPETTRQWVEHFVAGLNAVQAQRKRALDEKILGIRPEPYRLRDVLLLGRLAGADVNWPIYFSLLELDDPNTRRHWWLRFSQPKPALSTFDWLNQIAKSGSNCFAVSAAKSTTGAAFLAGDPHLGQHLPNIWMIAGVQCPSYKAVGLMFPGLPVFGMGRTPCVAWGGTNLRAASSDLVELSGNTTQYPRRETHIRVRWGRTRKRMLADSAHGPVLNECEALRPILKDTLIALRWAGHWPTDEITGFLEVMKSTHCAEVHTALGRIGVTPLNVLAADTLGNIGHSLATTLPRRQGFDAHYLISESQSTRDWSSHLNAHSLPYVLNPVCGYLASTNNKPEGDAPVGFYFNGADRQLQCEERLSQHAYISPETLLATQMNCSSVMAKNLAFELGQWLVPFCNDESRLQLCLQLQQWTGSYKANEETCLIFEALLSSMVEQLRHLLFAKRKLALMEEWRYLTDHLIEDLEHLAESDKENVAQRAMLEAEAFAQRWKNWGNVLKVRPRHALGYVPVLGKLFSSRALPASGSRETLHKNAHGLITGYQESSYGSQARHWSDLSNPDTNHFVLLGGQDGWVGSELMTDQIKLWSHAESIRMPLTLSLVLAEFPHTYRAKCST